MAFVLPVRLWPARQEHFILSVAFDQSAAAEGQARIAAGGDDGSVALYDLAAEKLLYRIAESSHAHALPVRSVAFLRQGSLLATGSDDSRIHLYDTRSQRLVAAFAGHRSWVLDLAVAPDENSIASASSDRCRARTGRARTERGREGGWRRLARGSQCFGGPRWAKD